MENKVTFTMKEQHKLKMVVDYEAGKGGEKKMELNLQTQVTNGMSNGGLRVTICNCDK